MRSNNDWKKKLVNSWQLVQGAMRVAVDHVRSAERAPSDLDPESKKDVNNNQSVPSVEKPIRAIAQMTHPKILLLDLPSSVTKVLSDAGLSVTEGSLGHPYKVKQGDDFVPLRANHHIPDLEEKDIIVANLAYLEPLDEPVGEEFRQPGQFEWWAHCSSGVVDPRPLFAKFSADSVKTVLTHGGVLIVFASSPPKQKYYVIRGGRTEGRVQDSCDLTTWELLPIRWWLQAEFATGTHIKADETGRIGSLLSRHTKGARYSCTLNNDSYSQNSSWKWIPLATNKHGACVAGVAVSEPKPDQLSLIVILPQEMDHGPFLQELLLDVLPDLTPHLYPEVTASRWTRHAAYELPRVHELGAEIAKVKAEAEKRVQVLQTKIDAEREQYGYLHDLLRETGEPLVGAVQKTFHLMGFTNVVDADSEAEGKPGGQKREDLRIEGSSPLLLIEIKGIGGMPSDAEALQVAKYLIPRMKELGTTDIQGLSVVNHQRNRAPLERDNKGVFRAEILTNAQEQHVGLLTTWDLFRLARSFLRHKWTHEHVRGVFYRRGRIEPIPGHYEPLGSIEHVFERPQAISIVLEHADLEVGDSVAFELQVEFEEQKVTSLQLEGNKVQRIEQGAAAGIKTGSITPSLKQGGRVFRLRRNPS